MAHQAPLKYIFYIAATPEKVWEGFVSRESNRILFSGAELQADFKPGGLLAWVGAGPDGKPMTYIQRKILRFEPPKVFQYTFAMGQNDKPLQLPSFAACARQFPDRSDLDAAHTSGRHLRGDLDGVIQAGGVNQIEPC